MNEVTNVPNPSPSKSPHPLVLIGTTAVVTAAIVGGGLYWWQSNQEVIPSYAPQPTTVPAPIEETAIPAARQPVTAGYKEVGVGNPYLTMEVPQSWSVTLIPESIAFTGDKKLSDFPMLSVGQKDVAYGDTNWSQVDFYYAQDDIVDALINENEGPAPREGQTTEKIAGLTAQVFTYALDGDQVTKAGTGGKSYYIKLPQNQYGVKTLYIHKQALGDQEFEDGVKHMLQTMSIQ